MVFGLFGAKKPSLKLLPKQELELRYENAAGESEYCFVQVTEVGKKKVSFVPAGKTALRLIPGQAVQVSALVDNSLFRYDASILDARDRDFDINLPKDVEESSVGPQDGDAEHEVTLPVVYRAMKSSYTQVAETQSIKQEGMTLLTNVPIPPGTPLHLTLTIPESGSEITTRAKAAHSEKLPDSRKATTFVEFEDIEDKDRATLIRCAIYQKHRH